MFLYDSGGEGCIVTTAGTAMGIGSDIGGSIRLPSYFNGIFGHKATVGKYVQFLSIPVHSTTLSNTVFRARNYEKFQLIHRISPQKITYPPQFLVPNCKAWHRISEDKKSPEQKRHGFFVY